MKYTNKQIYEINSTLNSLNQLNITLPVRIGFYLQKNIKLIQTAAAEIEAARLGIGMRFGIPNEEGSGYSIAPEHISVVNQELMELFNLEQDLDIHIFKLSDFDNMELNFQELSALMFMVEED